MLWNVHMVIEVLPFIHVEHLICSFKCTTLIISSLGKGISCKKKKSNNIWIGCDALECTYGC